MPTDDNPKEGLFKKMINGLAKTRQNILSGVDSLLQNFVAIDEELFESLEEMLILADLGMETAMQITAELRRRTKAERITNAAEVKSLLARVITDMLTENAAHEPIRTPSVILVLGVNGVGKTTTIGKLSHLFKADGKKVLVAAADTFRAAAIDQLEIWCSRNQVELIRHQDNSDPASVVYDAVAAAKVRKADILLCDTAGRLQNKKNLMEELKKISRVIDTQYAEAHREVFLVLDATTGQNGLQQAKVFQECVGITGIVLTKLDGTAKGGIVVAIQNELRLPVKYICTGEQVDDIEEFDAQAFAEALFFEIH